MSENKTLEEQLQEAELLNVELSKENFRLEETVAEQKRTIECLMVGNPEDTTTPTIVRIARLEKAFARAKELLNTKFGPLSFDFEKFEKESWIHLRDYGYAPGGYMSKCHMCGGTFIMDKRAITCIGCATIAYKKQNGVVESEKHTSLDDLYPYRFVFPEEKKNG